MTWPLCALILGLAFIAVLWDVGRRLAAAYGALKRVDEAIAASDARLEARMKLQSEAIDLAKRGVDAYVKQTTDQIQALQSGLHVRAMNR